MSSQLMSGKRKINPLLELFHTPPIRWTTVMKVEAVNYLRTIDFFHQLEKQGMDLTNMVLQASNVSIDKNQQVELYGQTVFLYSGEFVIYNKLKPKEIKRSKKSTLFMSEEQKKGYILETCGGLDYNSFIQNEQLFDHESGKLKVDLYRRVFKENMWHMYDYDKVQEIPPSQFHMAKKKPKKEKNAFQVLIAQAMASKTAIQTFKKKDNGIQIVKKQKKIKSKKLENTLFSLSQDQIFIATKSSYVLKWPKSFFQIFFRKRLERIYEKKITKLNDIFKGFQREQIKQLDEDVTWLKLNSGAYVYKEGQVEDCYYIVWKGSIELIKSFKTHKQGVPNQAGNIEALNKKGFLPKSAPIMILGETQSFGDFEMFKGQPKFFSAKVKSFECEVIKISLEQVETLGKMQMYFLRNFKRRSTAKFKVYLEILNGHPYAQNEGNEANEDNFQPMTTQEKQAFDQQNIEKFKKKEWSRQQIDSIMMNINCNQKRVDSLLQQNTDFNKKINMEFLNSKLLDNEKREQIKLMNHAYMGEVNPSRLKLMQKYHNKAKSSNFTKTLLTTKASRINSKNSKSLLRRAKSGDFQGELIIGKEYFLQNNKVFFTDGNFKKQRSYKHRKTGSVGFTNDSKSKISYKGQINTQAFNNGYKKDVRMTKKQISAQQILNNNKRTDITNRALAFLLKSESKYKISERQYPKFFKGRHSAPVSPNQSYLNSQSSTGYINIQVPKRKSIFNFKPSCDYGKVEQSDKFQSFKGQRIKSQINIRNVSSASNQHSSKIIHQKKRKFRRVNSAMVIKQSQKSTKASSMPHSPNKPSRKFTNYSGKPKPYLREYNQMTKQKLQLDFNYSPSKPNFRTPQTDIRKRFKMHRAATGGKKQASAGLKNTPQLAENGESEEEGDNISLYALGNVKASSFLNLNPRWKYEQKKMVKKRKLKSKLDGGKSVKLGLKNIVNSRQQPSQFKSILDKIYVTPDTSFMSKSRKVHRRSTSGGLINKNSKLKVQKLIEISQNFLERNDQKFFKNDKYR